MKVIGCNRLFGAHFQERDDRSDLENNVQDNRACPSERDQIYLGTLKPKWKIINEQEGPT